MVKPSTSSSSSSSSKLPTSEERRDSGRHYKGVRKRKWGKYVSEIRLPNSRERIWLGSYDTPEKAARAFDAALFCLRGKKASFNFPNNPPEIQGGGSLTPSEIQSVAAKFANEEYQEEDQPTREVSFSSRNLDSSEVSSSGYSSPAPSVTDGVVPAGTTDNLKMDWSFLDLLTVPESDINRVSDFSGFTGLDDLPIEFLLPPPEVDYVEENTSNNGFEVFPHQQSFLWNF
ncbi:AP2/ERF domain [Macleaya cordata]|uniref:AP2/ERF domain n=1 Tax=Macleaya cordata TaxID=56857 RepID=A0A200QCW3_MACCD|nr:AP2/ERF domain [Macleaya cordata]